MEIARHEPGMFSWADLGTTDVDGAKRFYTELLELDATDLPMGEGMSYTMLSKRGKNSCALYTMPEEMAQMTGGRPAWLSYFTVESADETAPRITELGGTVMNGPFDVFTSGRMVVAMDPAGAMFAVWEPRTTSARESSASRAPSPGTSCTRTTPTRPPASTAGCSDGRRTPIPLPAAAITSSTGSTGSRLPA